MQMSPQLGMVAALECKLAYPVLLRDRMPAWARLSRSACDEAAVKHKAHLKRTRHVDTAKHYRRVLQAVQTSCSQYRNEWLCHLQGRHRRSYPALREKSSLTMSRATQKTFDKTPASRLIRYTQSHQAEQAKTLTLWHEPQMLAYSDCA